MKQLFTVITLALMLLGGVACHNGQGDASTSAQSDSTAAEPRPELLVIYFFDGGDQQSMGEDIISAFDDLKDRFGDRIALWAIDSSINTDLYMQLDVQDVPAALFITDTQVPLAKLKVAKSISGDIDRESITQEAVRHLDP